MKGKIWKGRGQIDVRGLTARWSSDEPTWTSQTPSSHLPPPHPTHPAYLFSFSTVMNQRVSQYFIYESISSPGTRNCLLLSTGNGKWHSPGAMFIHCHPDILWPASRSLEENYLFLFPCNTIPKLSPNSNQTKIFRICSSIGLLHFCESTIN